jgi:hypothetical protein
VGRRLLPVPLRPVKPTQNVHLKGSLHVARPKVRGGGVWVCVGVSGVWGRSGEAKAKSRMF